MERQRAGLGRLSAGVIYALRVIKTERTSLSARRDYANARERLWQGK